MKHTCFRLFVLALLGASAGAPLHGSESPAVSVPRPEHVDLTIYNANFALIREVRPLSLGRGSSRLVVGEVPATIEPETVSLSVRGGTVRVLEQNYRYDLVSPAALLGRYLGREVEFSRIDPETKKEVRVTGRLLATGFAPPGPGLADSGLVAEIGGKVEINPEGRLVLPSIPEGLILKPELDWLVDSAAKFDGDASLSFLADNLSWKCDYVAVLGRAASQLALTSWVTIENHSGTSFRDAGVKLVAGDVNRVRPASPRPGKVMAYAAAEAPQFRERDLFEYKLYALGRTTDLDNDETKQIELAAAASVPFRKVFQFDPLAATWRGYLGNEGLRSQPSPLAGENKVNVSLSFRNDKASGLGMALPAGRLRVYQIDDDGKEQFVGEDDIDHTPADEDVRVFLGNAFDLAAERSQQDFHVVVADHEVEETYEVRLRNHKKEAVEIEVRDHPWRSREWDLVRSSSPGEKIDQSTIRWLVNVPPESAVRLTYTIRSRY